MKITKSSIIPAILIIGLLIGGCALVNPTVDVTQQPSLPPQEMQGEENPLTPTPTEAGTVNTSNEQTFTPTFSLGEDIRNDCFWDTYWFLYPRNPTIHAQNDCWFLIDKGGIYIADGTIYMVIANSTNNYPFMLYAFLPALDQGNQVKVSFSITIEEFTTNSTMNSDIVFGIGDPGSGLLNGQFIIYRILPNNPTYYVVYNTELEDSPEDPLLEILPQYYLGQPNELEFVIDNYQLDINLVSHRGSSVINYPVLDNELLDSGSDLVFWLGYSIRTGATLNAVITNFDVSVR